MKIVAVLAAWFFLVVWLPCHFKGRHEFNERPPGVYISRVMENFVWLPLTLTQHQPSATVRVLGLLAFFVWFFPAMAVAAPALLPLMFAEIFATAIRGYS